MKELTDLLADRSAQFKRPRSPLPGDLRPSYRIALLALALDACRGKRATLRKLYVLNWASKTAENRKDLQDALSDGASKEVAVRFEPSMGRAIDFAVAERLLRPEGKGRLVLSEKGMKYATDLQIAGCFQVEDAFFKLIGKGATESKIVKLLKSEEGF